jgi:hypothetical protein
MLLKGVWICQGDKINYDVSHETINHICAREHNAV